MSDDWQPGKPAIVETPRLTLKSLRAEDIPALEAAGFGFYGSDTRRKFLWSPPLPTADFLRGLAKVCDNKKLFAFLITRKDNGKLIGFVKAQITKLDGARTILPTVVIGDEADGKNGFGIEATGAAIWLGIEEREVERVLLKIYEEDVVTIKIAEANGFKKVKTEVEEATKKTVLHYSCLSGPWQKRNADKLTAFGCSLLA